MMGYSFSNIQFANQSQSASRGASSFKASTYNPSPLDHIDLEGHDNAMEARRRETSDVHV